MDTIKRKLLYNLNSRYWKHYWNELLVSDSSKVLFWEGSMSKAVLLLNTERDDGYR